MSLADECRSTGSYDGHPIEGFVIRCKDKETDSTELFKVKYDEPYLMFRE